MTDTFTEVRARIEAAYEEVAYATLPWKHDENEDGCVEIISSNGELILGDDSGFAFNLPEFEDLAVEAVNAVPTLLTHIDAQAERIRELEVENMRLKSNRAPTGAGWFG